jgi:hypothetical protein
MEIKCPDKNIISVKKPVILNAPSLNNASIRIIGIAVIIVEAHARGIKREILATVKS